MFIFTLILWAVAFVLSEVLRPKPKIENARPAHLGDFSFPTATEGRVVPVIWGTIRLDGPNVIWYGDLKSAALTDKVKTGMFSSTKVTTGYRYRFGMQLGLCRGVVDYVKRIWVGDKLLWEGEAAASAIAINKPNFYGGEDNGGGGIKGTLRFYVGTRDQTLNAYLAQEPTAYLWEDNPGTKGNNGQGFAEYRGSDENQYWRCSAKGQGGTLGPGNEADFNCPMRTENSPAMPVHIRMPDVLVAPGNLGTYNALLVHPNRPRISDNIKINFAFQMKDPGVTDFGGNYIFMGCKVQDERPITSQHGVFLEIIGQNGFRVRVASPSSGGETILVTKSAPGDFPTMIGQHEAELQIVGNEWKVLIDGVVRATGTSDHILTIPEDFQGFCLGMNGNLNSDFVGGDDQGFAGIYRFGIDSLLRTSSSDVPAYRGTCHAVWEKGIIGMSTQIDPWAFELQRCPNGLDLEDGKHIVNLGDANPMNVLYEILTDQDWGLSQSSGDVDMEKLVELAYLLYDEGNGWSFNLDNPIECAELIKEIERQIDGYVFVDRHTGKWTCTLARGGYVVEDLPHLNDASIVEVKSFTRGAWEETTNNVRVEFANRANDYKVTYALGQDTANIRVQDGTIVSTEAKYPGVKSKALANNIAWRDLRAQSYPLARAEVTVDRTFHATNPGDVVRWTYPEREIVDLPMRVTKVDLGSLDDSAIRLSLVQDVFSYELASFAPPEETLWLDPSGKPPANIDAAATKLIEAPRKFSSFADVKVGEIDRLWVGARYGEDGSGAFEIWTSENGGEYIKAGRVSGFILAGTLGEAMTTVADIGAGSLALEPTLDSKDDILEKLETHSANSIGRELYNFVQIDDEILAYTTFEDDGSVITLTGLYRGLLDTVPAQHAADAEVWLLHTAGNVTDVTFAPGANISVKLLSHNTNGTLDIGVAGSVPIVLNNRARRPYPPANLRLGDVPYPAEASMDDVSSLGRSQLYADDVIGSVIDPTLNDFEVGLRFTVTEPAVVVRARFWKHPSNSGTHTAYLWDETSETILASQVFTDETSTGWQSTTFEDLIELTPGTPYVISYSAPNGYFSRNVDEFLDARTFGIIETPANGTRYGNTAGAFPDIIQPNEYGIEPIVVPTASLANHGVNVKFSRRDLRNTDEVAALSETGLAADFPAANDTEYQIEVRDDADAVLFTTPWASDGEIILSRAKLLRLAEGFPASITLSISTRHTYEGVLYAATQPLEWTTTPVSPFLEALEALGLLGPAVASPAYAVASTGSYSLTLEAPLATGAVEVRVNGGSWSSVIAATLVTGTFAATAADDVEIRHGQTGLSGEETTVVLRDLTLEENVAFAVLVKG